MIQSTFLKTIPKLPCVTDPTRIFGTPAPAKFTILLRTIESDFTNALLTVKAAPPNVVSNAPEVFKVDIKPAGESKVTAVFKVLPCVIEDLLVNRIEFKLELPFTVRAPYVPFYL